jgi:hypothetical protein
VLLATVGSGCLTLPEGDPSAEGRRESGIFPIYRKVTEGDRTEVQSLWPLLSHVEQPGKEMTKLLPLFWREDLTVGDHRDVDWGFLALLLGGHDPEEGEYLALFPLGGNLKGVLHKDEIRFVLFPLYVDTRRDGYESTHLVWPLVSWGEGDGHRDFRILPFYSHREEEGKRWSTAVMWPFLTWREDDLHTDHPSKSFFFFPFYGRKDSDKFWSRTYLWPLFGFAGGENGWSEQIILWPVYRRAELPGKYRAFRVWPLFGYIEEGDEYDRYMLWPIVRERSSKNDRGGRTDSFWIVPFWWNLRYSDEEGNDAGAEVQLWPLVKRRRHADGSRDTRILSLIPFTGWGEWEANYAWAWTLWSVSRDADGGRSGSALLGLLSWEDRPERGRIELLKGFLGYDRDEEGPGIRLLWLLRIPL